ncbi:MAG: hypothetical protein M1365_14795 [Actinobacteria bacterium]|nr:hypothetical protein [Actinomycetota bacterium]
MKVKAKVVFHPNWYYKNFGISFDENFFFDFYTRIESERLMKKGLYEKFGHIGLGEKNPKDEPIVGTYNLAAGWFLENMLGCDLVFLKDNSPVVLPKNISDKGINELDVPNFPDNDNKYFMRIKKLMDKMEEKFGYLKGDLNLQGVQNIAFFIRGQELYIDYYYKPELAKILLSKITKTIIKAAKFFKSKTGSCSLSSSPAISEFDESLFVTSNCTIDMISTNTYKDFLMEFDNILSDELQPFGIHHCGARPDEFSYVYSKVRNVSFYEAGWGGDIGVVRKNFPDAFISARLSPVKILKQTNEDFISDILNIVKKGKPLEKLIISICGLDFDTPDEKIELLFNVCNNLDMYL